MCGGGGGAGSGFFPLQSPDSGFFSAKRGRKKKKKTWTWGGARNATRQNATEGSRRLKQEVQIEPLKVAKWNFLSLFSSGPPPVPARAGAIDQELSTLFNWPVKVERLAESERLEVVLENKKCVCVCVTIQRQR